MTPTQGNPLRAGQGQVSGDGSFEYFTLVHSLRVEKLPALPFALPSNLAKRLCFARW